MKIKLIASAALVFFVAACSSEQSSTTEIAATVDDAATPQVTYVTTDTFEEQVLQSDVPVLVDFTAVWCVPCKEVDPIIMSLYPEMHGRAKVFKLDIDDDPDIYQQLGVNGVPHILFFNKGKELDRISSPQPREVYVDYLDAMIDGRSTLEVSMRLLDNDEFRRHFLSSKRVEDLQKALESHPTLLTDPLENGQSPLSMYLNIPNYFQNDLIELALANGAEPTPRDLVGLGQCDRFLGTVKDDPEALDRPDVDGATPLYLAVSRAARLGNSDCANALLRAGANPGANPHQRYNLGRSAVFRAEADPDLFVKLLDRGLDPAVTDEQGKNLLHMAVSYSYTPVVRELVGRGVDLKATTFDGKTAADIAREAIQRGEKNLEKGVDSKGLELTATYAEYIRSGIAKKQEIITILEG